MPVFLKSYNRPQTWQEEVVVDSYELTNSRKHYSFTQKNFHLEPEEYKIEISITDVETKKSSKRKIVYKLKDYSDKDLCISDIIMTEYVEIKDAELKSIKPYPADYVRSTGTELYSFFEIYSRLEKERNFKISYNFWNK